MENGVNEAKKKEGVVVDDFIFFSVGSSFEVNYYWKDVISLISFWDCKMLLIDGNHISI